MQVARNMTHAGLRLLDNHSTNGGERQSRHRRRRLSFASSDVPIVPWRWAGDMSAHPNVTVRDQAAITPIIRVLGAEVVSRAQQLIADDFQDRALAALRRLPRRPPSMVPNPHERPLLCTRLMQASQLRIEFVERSAALLGPRCDWALVIYAGNVSRVCELRDRLRKLSPPVQIALIADARELQAASSRSHGYVPKPLLYP